MVGRLFILALLAALTGGCSKTEEKRSSYEGRSETKKLQGADAVGYDGTAIRKSVDNSLNKSDQHNESMDKALKSDEPQK